MRQISKSVLSDPADSVTQSWSLSELNRAGFTHIPNSICTRSVSMSFVGWLRQRLLRFEHTSPDAPPTAIIWLPLGNFGKPSQILLRRERRPRHVQEKYFFESLQTRWGKRKCSTRQFSYPNSPSPYYKRTTDSFYASVAHFCQTPIHFLTVSPSHSRHASWKKVPQIWNNTNNGVTRPAVNFFAIREKQDEITHNTVHHLAWNLGSEIRSFYWQDLNQREKKTNCFILSILGYTSQDRLVKKFEGFEKRNVSISDECVSSIISINNIRNKISSHLKLILKWSLIQDTIISRYKLGNSIFQKTVEFSRRISHTCQINLESWWQCRKCNMIC